MPDATSSPTTDLTTLDREELEARCHHLQAQLDQERRLIRSLAAGALAAVDDLDQVVAMAKAARG